MEGLEGPAVFDQADSEVIKELLVGRSCTLKSEVARGGDDSAAEVTLPETIRNDTSSERVPRIDNPFRELDSPTGTLRDGGALE